MSPNHSRTGPEIQQGARLGSIAVCWRLGRAPEVVVRRPGMTISAFPHQLFRTGNRGNRQAWSLGPRMLPSLRDNGCEVSQGSSHFPCLASAALRPVRLPGLGAWRTMRSGCFRANARKRARSFSRSPPISRSSSSLIRYTSRRIGSARIRHSPSNCSGVHTCGRTSAAQSSYPFALRCRPSAA